MATELAVRKEIVNILESNLVDPNGDRLSLNKKWIYEDLPRTDLSQQKYPRISVTTDTTNIILHELGQSQQRVTMRLAIQIRTTKGAKYNGYYQNSTAEEVVDTLSYSIIEVLRKEYTYNQLLDKLSIFDIRLESENQLYDNSIIVKVLTYKITMRR